MRRSVGYLFVAGCTMLLLYGCSSEIGDSKERVPADAPGYVKGKPVHPSIKIGKPYRVNGNKYYPKYDPDYDEIGIASWYGPNFHGKMTANGETYNQWAMTAAHPTLPLPSMVRVTDVQSGKSIIVRINDRGPFANGRIIDLSRAAAEELGTYANGVAKVRVQYLKPETERYIAKLNLKKPESWRKTDVIQAKIEQKLDKQHAVLEKPEIAPVPASEAKANKVSEQFAYEEEMPDATTIGVRGVQMKEVGYAEDAFSVIDDSLHNRALAETHNKTSPQPFISPSALSSHAAKAKKKQIFVQAGTFSVEANARRLAKRLQAITTVQIVPVTGDDKNYWLVRLGPAFNLGIARQIRQKLQAFDIADARIVKE